MTLDHVFQKQHVYNECDKYSPLLAASKPQFQIEYSGELSSCPTVETGVSVLQYSKDTLNSGLVDLVCYDA